MALAQRAAEEAPVLGVAGDRPAVDRAGGADHAVAGDRRARRAATSSTRERSTRTLPGSHSASSRSSGRSRADALRGRRWRSSRRLPGTRATRCGRRTRTSWRSPAAGAPLPVTQRPRLARARSRGRARGRAPRSRASARSRPVISVRMRGHRLDRAGGAEQMADRRLGRGDRDALGARSPSASFSAAVSAASLSWVEVPWALM